MILLTSKLDKECKSIDINHLIVLCELGDEYKSFCDDLEKLIDSKTKKDLINDVYKVIKGKFSLHSHKYKEFIEKHQHAIDVMNQYYCTSNLTVLSYDFYGKRRQNLPEDYFFLLLRENTNHLDMIKEVVYKLKKLGFRKINYGENLDFSNYEYILDANPFGYSSSFVFLENMTVYPTYLTDPIKYGTTGSNYCMCLERSMDENSKYSRNIYLNNLAFDPNKLPDEISASTTLGIILELAKAKSNEYLAIRNSVSFSIGVDDLCKQYECLHKVVEGIDTIKNKEELISLMSQMYNLLTSMQKCGETYENEITEANPNITSKTIEQEKKLYLHRRYMSNIDID